MKLLLVLAAIFAMTQAHSMAGGTEMKGEEALMMQLLGGEHFEYHKLVRPARQESETVNVSTSVMILRINGFNERSSSLSIDAWTHIGWVDYRLTWDPAEFDGVEYLSIPVNRIWTPDLTLYYHNGPRLLSDENLLGMVKSDGHVLYVTPNRILADCFKDGEDMDPGFDCTFKYGPWVYDSDKTRVEVGSESGLTHEYEGMVSREYIKNDKYTIFNALLSAEQKTFPCCPKKYSVVSGYMRVGISQEPVALNRIHDHEHGDEHDHEHDHDHE